MGGEDCMVLSKTRLVRVTVAFGCLSLIAVVASYFSLTDIGRGDPEVAFEWNVLELSAFIVSCFLFASILTLWQSLKDMD